MKVCTLYLSGRYKADDLGFYSKLSRGTFKVAVDGGLRFFVKTGIRPDLLIGDLDSLGRYPAELISRAEILQFPAAKDKTDLELALDLCLERGASEINVVMPTVGEVDHFLGTVELLRFGPIARAAKRLHNLRLINPAFELISLTNDSVEFRRCRGDRLSVFPSGERIRLTLSGTEYDVDSLCVIPGETRALRNRIVAERAEVSVEGSALIYRGRSRSHA